VLRGAVIRADLAIMVNGPLPRSRAESREPGTATNDAASGCRHIAAGCGDAAMFVQILAKLDFFKFGEILPLILFDYAEKRADTTNASFKRA
jgi:hypothetical protein